MAINSKVELCNMAVNLMGNYGTINDIDDPETDKEVTFALWYDVSREVFLKMIMPNFAIARKRVAQVSEDIPYPFTYGYEYPSDCLKALGIGAVEDKKNDYTIENNRIYTDVLYEDGLPLRYIKDFKDVSLMSPEFKIGFSWFLASNTVMEITQDVSKANKFEKLLPSKMSAISGINAQENMPIRISRSKFEESRRSGFASDHNKR